ncbi:hypothetical protein HPP92_026320 [Vanilla planifolia]|uniref:BHLH domain-containing protein n=1 Tax=Vanilla planifolia TaxID=51239 RepID=A0A835PGJ3_VANPL|nr:hypothetical protein HPP92_026547 [Vanilla planifolia]KAG0451295.1 hypothetical protein HPP92_026320 [Vanilla planifolia]
MGSPENHNWFIECPLIDDFSVPPGNDFIWAPQGFNDSLSNGSMAMDGSYMEKEAFKEQGSRKRVRLESSSQPGSKACREKMRRDRLNDKFLELGSILEPGKPPKMDKAAILNDATRMVNQLRSEAEKLKESNDNLQEKIRELKAEKIELREEKQRLKAEKESLEQQVKLLNARTSFLPHPPVVPTTFAAQGNTAGQKLVMPIISYPGFPMWQFMQPSDVDTSQDAESRPPVA